MLEQLVRNLDPGQRPVLRLGGDTGDWSWYPIAHMPRPRVNDLADALAMDQTSLSRTLRTMERDELLAEVSGEDKRESRWILGPEGQQRFKRALPAWRSAQKSVEKLLGADAQRISSAAYELATRLSD